METHMSKKQHGNKEAKKPKQAKPLINPAAPVGATASAVSTAPDRLKKKK
jgi:hypothetical protein